MAVSLSSRIGPFEVISPIGAGGMGEVFRVIDPRIGREAAVKVLPAEYAHDSARLRRFEQEARAAGSLSHPNLVTIYELGTHDEAPYIAMELLEGTTLREKLRDILSARQAVRLAMQIANGLAAAHERGIIHRDIKPENIFLTYDGQTKILDFGVAKLRHPPDDTGELRPAAEQENLEKVAGTAAYMSPEQIRNDPVDHRSDIFSLGAVLYEMLSGRPAFHAATAVATMNAILHEDPPPLAGDDRRVSPALERIVRRCLEKEPDQRFDSARDVVFALEAVLELNGATVPNGLPASSGRRNRLVRNLALAMAAIVTLGIAALFVVRRNANPQRSDSPSIESTISLEGTGGIGYWSGPPALSPDGTTLAFIASDENGRSMLWVRPLSGGAPRALANTEDSTSPFWSADGRFIAFYTLHHLKKIPRDGGPVEIITTSALMFGGTWSREDIVYVGRKRSAMMRVSAAGGDPMPILMRNSISKGYPRWPYFLPDGRHVLFLAEGPELERVGQAGIWVTTIDRSEGPRFVTHGAANMAYVEPGWLLTMVGGVLRAQRFDVESVRVTGDPVTIAPVSSASWNNGALFTATTSGLLAYLPAGESPTSELLLKNAKGEVVRRLARGFLANPRFSLDGRRVAVDISEESGNGDIWILGSSGESTSRVTFDPANETAPVWGPDGNTIAYTLGTGDSSISVVREGKRAESLIDLPNAGDGPTDWTRDGRYLAVVKLTPATAGDVVVFDVQTKKVIEVAATPAHESAGVFSPDGRWIAYQSDENGGWEVYVQPFPPTGAKYQVSNGGGHWPRWRSPDDILYVDETNHLESVQVKTSATFAPSPPRALPVIVPNRGNVFWSDYDVARDGTVVVNSLVYDNPPPLTLVTNLNQRLEANEKK